jgi:hypothetical protein
MTQSFAFLMRRMGPLRISTLVLEDACLSWVFQIKMGRFVEVVNKVISSCFVPFVQLLLMINSTQRNPYFMKAYELFLVHPRSKSKCNS